MTYIHDTKSTNACISLVDSLKYPTDPNIIASLSLTRCDNTPPQIQGEMNYEALKLVSNDSIHTHRA